MAQLLTAYLGDEYGLCAYGQRREKKSLAKLGSCQVVSERQVGRPWRCYCFCRCDFGVDDFANDQAVLADNAKTWSVLDQGKADKRKSSCMLFRAFCVVYVRRRRLTVLLLLLLLLIGSVTYSYNDYYDSCSLISVRHLLLYHALLHCAYRG